MFESIVNAVNSAEEYMIDINTIVFDLDYIFVNVSTCEAAVICIPVIENEKNNIDLALFFKNIMFSTQFDQTENSDHVTKIMNYMNSTPGFSPTDFKKLILELKTESRQTAQTRNITIEQKQTPKEKKVENNNSFQSVSPKVKTENEQNNIKKSEHVNKFDIPVPVKNNEKIENNNTEQKDEEEISWFYLMQHYNKENAAKYKAQKAGRKAGKNKSNNADKSNKNSKPPVSNVGYAVPGIEKKADVIQEKSQPENNIPENNITVNKGTANFGETTILGTNTSKETTVLGGAASGASKPKLNPRLIRSKNDENIPINKPVFRIGKEKSYVDYFISDNSAVSRSHANIVVRDDNFFVVDTNSTNHTYVNGIMVQSNVETSISDKDMIRFANEDFEFRIY